MRIRKLPKGTRKKKKKSHNIYCGAVNRRLLLHTECNSLLGLEFPEKIGTPYCRCDADLQCPFAEIAFKVGLFILRKNCKLIEYSISQILYIY